MGGPQPARRRLGVALTVLAQSTQSLSSGGIALFLPLIRRDLGLTFTQAGAIAASASITYAVMQSLRSRGVLAVGSGDGHLPDLPPARNYTRWFRPPRPSALRLPSLSSGLHPRFQRCILGLPLAA
jgi:hypothetical protein